MASLDELWAQVVEAPDDIGARLVLADALIEAGDPRGELISLQLRGADAKVLVGDRPTDENTAERVSELIAHNWTTWLGDTAQLLVRQGSVFRDGFLYFVQVGGENTPHTAWTAFRGHRELCAVHEVKPFKCRSDHYAMFLAALARDPHSVDIHAPLVIRNIHARRKQWAVRHVRYGGVAWWSLAEGTRAFTAELQLLAEVAQDIETIDIPSTHAAIGEIPEAVAMMPKLFPKLRRVKVEEISRGWLRGGEVQLRAMPHVVLED